MKVRELIELLRQQDPEAEALVPEMTKGFGWEPVTAANPHQVHGDIVYIQGDR